MLVPSGLQLSPLRGFVSPCFPISIDNPVRKSKANIHLLGELWFLTSEGFALFLAPVPDVAAAVHSVSLDLWRGML